MVILGDPAYPALPWLMKPYQENASTTDAQKLFNYRQSRARMVVENAFGRLKGRWRCLQKRLDCKLANVPNIVAACAVLHNFCEQFGDACPLEWTQGQSQNSSSVHTSSSTLGSSSSGSEIRDAIMRHLSI